jgi:RHS repeat-associated protein
VGHTHGDGRADFLTLNSTSAKPILAINRPSALGNDFSTLPAEVGLSGAATALYNLGTPDLSFNLPVVATIDNTFQQVIDFNGDGRPDIIVATEGRNDAGAKDVTFWKILVNLPGPSGKPSDIRWVERHVDITAIRAIVQQGHVLSLVSSSDNNSKPLPVQRTHQAGAFINNTVVESSVITQWKLIDVNGDGFPDFVFNSNGVTARDEQICDPAGVCKQGMRQDNAPGNSLLVIYHTGPMMAGSGAETQSVWRGPAVELRRDGACGVSRVTFLGGGMHQLTCGFMEANGDGLVDYVINDGSGNRVIRSSGLSQAHDILLPENQSPADFAQQEFKRSITLPGPVGLVRDPRLSACPAGAPGTRRYEIEQLTDLRDITGDGIADYIFFGGPRLPPGSPGGPQGWWFMAGTGVGFTEARAIRSPASVPFALHVSSERCDGKFSNVIASLIDLDGDGRPEIVRALGPMKAVVAKLVNADGQIGAHNAGQIVAIDNRYGSVTKITYGSSKSDWLGRQNVPFPQIVVTHTEQTADFGLGTELAPTRYAYGEPEQVYHSLLGRFVFRGFLRRVEIRGERTPSFNVIKGTAIISTGLAAREVTGDLDRLMLTGRPRNVRMLAGSLNADPRLLLADGGPVTHSATLQTVWRIKALPGAVPGLVPLDEECYATPAPQTPGIFSDLSLCRRAATSFIGEQASSEGTQAFPSPNSVATRTEVTEVDDFARPRRIRSEGDRRRTDDDVCMQVDYATAVAGAPLVLNTVRRMRTHECGYPLRVLAGSRFQYDDLPEPQVGIGRVSGQVLERYDVSTGTLIQNLESRSVQRDAFGNPRQIQRPRADGAVTTTTVAWDPFGLAPVRSETTATGLAEPLIWETVRDPHSLLPLTVFNPNRAATHNAYDNFNRLKRISLTLPGDPIRYVLVDKVFMGFAGGPSGRSVRQRIYSKLIPESTAADAPSEAFRTVTSLFDELGRPMYGLVELGPDYNNQQLVIDLVTYDDMGRPRFTAAPFPASIFGPRYGSTITYRPDGRPECIIEGVGRQTDATTDEALDRYPSCVQYIYRNGELRIRIRGPNELAVGKPQSGAYDEQVFSATGQLLSIARKRGRVRFDLAEYRYDRLGSLSFLRRWVDPESSSTNVTWTWNNDSSGNVLVAAEPAGVKRVLAYDDWGNLSSVQWRDSTGPVVLERGVHLVYDGLDRLLRTHESVNGEKQDDTIREYFYDTPSGQPQHFDTQFLKGRLSFARTNGGAVFLGYDSLGRMTTVSRSDSVDNFHFAQRAQIGPSGQTETMALFTPETESAPDLVTYTYDSARRLQSATFKDASGTSELWRALDTDIFGRILSSRLGNGATEHFRYRPDARRELQSHRIEAGGRTRVLQFNGFDGAMLLRGTTEISNISGALPTETRYTYDVRRALARAVVETPAGIASEFRYAYDGLGNVRSITDAAGVGSLEVRVDTADADRICSIVKPGAPLAPCSYRYDATGNVRQIRDSRAVFDHDGSGRLRSTRRGTRRASMQYDAFGRLTVLHVADGQLERRETILGAGTRVGFFDSAGNPKDVGPPGATLNSFTERAIPSPVGWLAVVRRSNTGSGATLYPIGEAQGTRTVLDGNAEPTQTIAYDAYGSVLADDGNPASLTWWPYQWNGGHVLDGLGLVMLGSRVLESRVGRLLQRDPIVNLESSAAAHPYAFARNDPANMTDRSGAKPERSSDGLFSFFFGFYGGLGGDLLRAGTSLANAAVTEGIVRPFYVESQRHGFEELDALTREPSRLDCFKSVGGFGGCAGNGLTATANAAYSFLSLFHQMLLGMPDDSGGRTQQGYVHPFDNNEPLVDLRTGEGWDNLSTLGPRGGVGGRHGFRGPATSAPIWTSTSRLSGIENALEHFKKHGGEFPGLRNAKEYVESARRFTGAPPAGALTKIRATNGDVVIYHPATNTFGVRTANGVPRTMFKPDPARHGYKTNMDYFNAQ